ncbi:MAG TPA: DUF2993 domain-containing protein [Allocoleopsis sp.]
MELITILLSALIGVLSPVGSVVDSVAEHAIRDQLAAAETLDVRIDNTPNYRYLQGRADRIRIAGRGVYPIEDLRIDQVEVETDPIAVDPDRLRQGKPELEKPLQAAIKIVLTEADLNQALQSDDILDQLDDLNLDFVSDSAAQYNLIDPQLQFLAGNRIRLQVTLQQQNSTQQNSILIETGIRLVSGSQAELVDPVVSFDDSPVPPELLDYFIAGVNQLLDLKNLETSGITARVLKLEVEGDRLTLVSFVRVEPDAELLK